MHNILSIVALLTRITLYKLYDSNFLQLLYANECSFDHLSLSIYYIEFIRHDDDDLYKKMRYF